MSKLRNEIFQMIEENYDNNFVVSLLHKKGYSDNDIFEEIKDNEESLLGSIVFYNDMEISFSEWLICAIGKLRKDIESNNKIFKDISKHDIIKSRSNVMETNVELSNELYYLKKYIEQLENDKKDLQIKLVKARDCLKCYGCKDDTCINNIWYKSTK